MDQAVVGFLQAYIILLQETKLSDEASQKIFKKWTLWDFIHIPIVGAFGGILTLWNTMTIKEKTLSQGTNWHLILIEIFYLSFVLFNIYGPIAPQEKHALWNTITCQIQ